MPIIIDAVKKAQNWDRTKPVELLCSVILAWLLLTVTTLSHAGEFPGVTQSQETVGSLDELGSGAFMVAQSDGGYRVLPRLNTAFSLTVSGMVVEAVVTQAFVNDTDQWIEGQYVFPLPSDSAVNGMKIRIGDRVIEGQIKEKKAARKIFLAARQQGKKASLVEQQRPNLFTNHVTNIAPGERIDVELHYLQTLRYDQGEFSLRIPMTLTPRYIPGEASISRVLKAEIALPLVAKRGWAFNTDQVPDANLITPPQRTVSELEKANQRVIVEGNDVLGSQLTTVATVAIKLTPGFELASLTSPYHDISSEKLHGSTGTYQVRLKKQWVSMNRDFELRWRPVVEQAPVAAFFNETTVHGDARALSEAHHGLVMIMPPEDLTLRQVTDRELVLIIDTSGSMAGTSMEQAKQALMVALQRLSPADYFNVIEFNSVTHRLFERSVIANADNIKAAQRYVMRLTANGGTEMRRALEAALLAPPVGEVGQSGGRSARVRQVVFITDGSVGNEEALFSFIVDHVGPSRLFTVAIGSAPNGYFMKKAAQFGRGFYTAIGSVQEVNQVMVALFEKIEKPLLTDVKVVFHNAGKAEYYPAVIPDLYANEPLLLMVKLAEPSDTITISGEYAGRFWQQNIVPDWSVNQPGVGTLWASKKIDYLMDEGVRQGNRDQFREAIITLGVDYRIMSRYTSFVAVDQEPSRLPSDNLQQHKIANSMPKGSAQPARSVAYPTTALGLNELILSGLLSLFLCLLVLCWKQDKNYLNETYGELATVLSLTGQALTKHASETQT